MITATIVPYSVRCSVDSVMYAVPPRAVRKFPPRQRLLITPARGFNHVARERIGNCMCGIAHRCASRQNRNCASATLQTCGGCQHNGGTPMKKSPRFDLLIVDDDDEFRELLLHRLEKSGYAVQAAASGEEALRAAQRRHFDVAVFDMHMPGLSGLELLERVQGESCRLRGSDPHRPGEHRHGCAGDEGGCVPLLCKSRVRWPTWKCRSRRLPSIAACTRRTNSSASWSSGPSLAARSSANPPL